MPATKAPPRKTKKKAAKDAKAKKAAQAAAPKVEMKLDDADRLKLYEKKSKEEKAIDTQIVEVERKIVAVGKLIDSSKSELKSLKTQHSTLHNELRQVVRGEGNLFADANEPKAESKPAEVSNRGLPIIPPGVTPALPVDDGAWRAVRLDSLTPKIKPGKLAQLAEAGIETVGQVQDFSAEHGEWWTKRISGFGESGHKQVGDAMEAFWAARQKAQQAQAADAAMLQNAEKAETKAADPQKLPGADELRSLNNPAADDFTEDAPAGTPECIATVDHHLGINVVRYTSGRWRNEYSLSVGALDIGRELDASPSFPTREEAAQSAIDYVRAELAKVRGTMNASTDKVAQKIVWALDSGEKTLAAPTRKSA